jgi:hypothetical protein
MHWPIDCANAARWRDCFTAWTADGRNVRAGRLLRLPSTQAVHALLDRQDRVMRDEAAARTWANPEDSKNDAVN